MDLKGQALMIGIILVVLSLIFIGVLLWLYIEEVRFTTKQDNFTDQGWSDWRRTLILVFAIITIVLLSLQAIGIFIGFFGQWFIYSLI